MNRMRDLSGLPVSLNICSGDLSRIQSRAVLIITDDWGSLIRVAGEMRGMT